MFCVDILVPTHPVSNSLPEKSTKNGKFSSLNISTGTSKISDVVPK